MPGENKPYNPLVSVIIPCYNGSQYLAQALDSVLNQSYTNWECIVADDGSTDNSKEVVLSYARKDSRFNYVYQNNAGPSAARNLGIKASKGDFFQFLDSDDLIEKEKLKRQLEIFRNIPSGDLVYGDMRYFSEPPDGRIQIRANDDKYWKNGRISGQGNEIIKTLLTGNIMVVHSPLIRRNVFEKIGLWDEQIWFNEDWDVWTRCALSGLSFQFDDREDTYALVREHPGSRSRDIFKMNLHGFKVCLKINRVIKAGAFKKIIRSKIYSIQRVIENEILVKYAADKQSAYEMTSALYNETKLFHYRIFAWLIHSMPVSFCTLFSKGVFLFNRIKCKILYES